MNPITELILPREINIDGGEPYETIAVDNDPDGFPCPDEYKDKIMIDVIHDGNHIPEVFLKKADNKSKNFKETLQASYCHERDWGAEIVAAYLASALHINSYFRINIARTLLDFGRFPGITHQSADHMQRFAINYPFSECLSFEHKKNILEDYYDIISKGIEDIAKNKILKIAIHAYDTRNPNNTKRPAVSIVTRSHGHQKGLDIPVTMFDPLVPDTLAEMTADPILRARIALTLEEAAIPVADNYPYTLPEGSVEVRSQVWFFFRYIQQKFETSQPQNPDAPEHKRKARKMVWDMLLDTNLRSTQSEALRSYLHMFRKPPKGENKTFQHARIEYEKITQFMKNNNNEIANQYNNFIDRPSSILIEVRKDLIWTFNNNRPVTPIFKNAQLIAKTIALAIQMYLIIDRSAKAQATKNRDPSFF